MASRWARCKIVTSQDNLELRAHMKNLGIVPGGKRLADLAAAAGQMCEK